MSRTCRIARIGGLQIFPEDDSILLSEELVQILDTSPDAVQTLEAFWRYFHPDSVPHFQKALESLQKGSDTFEQQLRIVTKSGDEKWVLYAGQAEIIDGGPPHIFVAIQDISSQKAVEHALLQKERELNRLLESTSAILWRGTPSDYHFTFVSKEAENILGYPVEMWLNTPNFWVDHIHPEDRKWVVDFCVTATEKREKHEFDYRMIAASGEVVWLRDIVNVVEDENGGLESFGIMIDVTERNTAIEKLVESETRYRTLVDKSPLPLLIHSGSKIVFINQAAIEIFGGESPSQFIGVHISKMLDPNNLRDFHQWHRALEDDGFIPLHQQQFRRLDGMSIEVEVVAARTIYDGKAAVQEIFIDVSEREHAVKALQEQMRLNARILQSMIDGYMLMNAGGRILDVNSAYCRICGYDREDLQNLRFQELDDAGDVQPFQERLEIIKREGSCVYETRHRCKNGGVKELSISMVIIASTTEPLIAAFIHDISERKQTEEKLMESEQILNLYLSQSLSGVFFMKISPALPWKYSKKKEELLDTAWRDLRIHRLNRALQEQYRATKRQLKNAAPEQLYSTTEWRGKQLLKRLFQKGRLHIETPTRRFDGEEMWVEGDYFCLTDAEGHIKGVFGIQKDITNRKSAEEEKERRNRELALLNQVISASVVGLPLEAILETACRELGKTFALPRVEAALYNENQDGAMVVSEYLAEAGYSGLGDRILVPGTPLVEEIQKQHGPIIIRDVTTAKTITDSQELTALCSRRGIRSMMVLPLIADQRLIGIMALQSDQVRSFSNDEIDLAWNVTDQVAGAVARAQLSETYQRLSTAIEQTPESIIITDALGQIVYVNPAFEKISGYSRDEVIGISPGMLKSGALKEDFYNDLWRTLRAGQVWQGHFINRKKSGELYTDEATIAPVRDKNGLIINYVSVQRDVTREIELEAQLRQAQKMEAIGKLAGGIAHDFNNMLTIIQGYASLPLEMNLLEPNHPVRAHLNNIQDGAERATKLTRQLLTFARRHIAQPRVVNINESILNLDKMLRRLISADIELVILPQAEADHVIIDPAEFEQVMMNLVVNARDAMPRGGKIRIQTGNQQVDGAHGLPIPDLEPGQYLHLQVTDNGVGMSQEVQDRIFEPFYTTKPIGHGTGLGLATCFGIVKEHNGHIWVKSEPEKGSRFHILLPTVPAPEQPAERLTDAPLWKRGSERILIVEDEPAVRDLASQVLRGLGYQVWEASNGESALRLFEEDENFEIDLLVTDVVMPLMGGVELAGTLEAKFPQMKMLFISGYTEQTAWPEGDPDKAFLQKPFAPHTLAQKVRQVLDQS